MTPTERRAYAFDRALRATGDEDLADAVQDILHDDYDDSKLPDADFKRKVEQTIIAYAMP